MPRLRGIPKVVFGVKISADLHRAMYRYLRRTGEPVTDWAERVLATAIRLRLDRDDKLPPAPNAGTTPPSPHLRRA